MNYRWILWFILVLFVMVLSACGGSGASSGSVPEQVTETDFKITSSVTTFSPDTSYHFVVTNNTQTAHEFMMMPKAEGSMSG
ncbi:MAG TPA: hypothetical protein VEL31_08115, partial [Ktedonobacteraceae bacterium]|nr:hypothetical protein [Ktedonobacteraceae bacterium]